MQCYNPTLRKPAWMLHCYMLYCYTTYMAVHQNEKGRQGQQVQFILRKLILVGYIYLCITL